MRKRSYSIERARAILLKIRQKRTQGLNEYCEQCIQSKTKKIWNGQEVKDCSAQDLRFIKAFSLIIDPPFEVDTIDANIFFHPKGSIDEFLKAWCRDTDNEQTFSSRQSFCALLKRGKLWSSKENNNPVMSVLQKIFTDEKMYSWLTSLEVPMNTRTTYESYVISFAKFCTNNFLSAMSFFPYYCPKIFPQEAAQFLWYLEEIALKSTTLKRYADLLLARTIIYTGLPVKALLSLKKPNINELFLRSESVQYPVTRSFIELWECFSLEEFLFPPQLRNLSNPEQALNIKFKRLGIRTSMTFRLTPTVLGNTLRDLRSTARYCPSINYDGITAQFRKLMSQLSLQVHSETKNFLKVLKIKK